VNLKEYVEFVKLSTPVGKAFEVDVHFWPQTGIIDERAPHRISFRAIRLPHKHSYTEKQLKESE